MFHAITCIRYTWLMTKSLIEGEAELLNHSMSKKIIYDTMSPFTIMEGRGNTYLEKRG